MTGFTILWHDSSFPPGTSRVRADEPIVGVQHWRGIRDLAASLWLIPDDLDAQVVLAIIEQQNIASDHVRRLKIINEWGDVVGKAWPIANFVLREMQPGSMDSFLPKLHSQIAQVVSRPGCLGSVLAAEKDTPDHLLGITYWDAEQSFAQYMEWASVHPWKNTVDPVTLNVPLRLLTRRTEASAATISDQG
jgi:quinol monooxygenase YgiN